MWFYLYAHVSYFQALPWHIDVYSDLEVELKVESLVALTANQVLGELRNLNNFRF